MMGRQSDSQKKLFYPSLSLEKRVRKDHILRKIARHIDFDFIYRQVEDTYGCNGNVSIPPPVILKMLLLLILYNVRSERELMQTIPERLDWMWFLGYDLDDEIPNHSVLSKARSRWGPDAFKLFFDTIVMQCVEAGLVDGSKIFVDASFVQADASNNSVVNQHSLKRYLNRSYQQLQRRLQEGERHSSQRPKKRGRANRKYISTTDPDASVVRCGAGRCKLRYKLHRSVDEKAEIITATQVTAGEVNEAHRLGSLIDAHEKNTGEKLQTAVADSKYGTIDNYLHCRDQNVQAHFESVEKALSGSGRRKGIFDAAAFAYDRQQDRFICPAGKQLRPRKYKKKRKHLEYSLPAKICNACSLKDQCTRSKHGRTLKRHVRQHELDQMIKRCESRRARDDIRKRQHLMERSFARSIRYGYKRARWRRLWRVQIQEYVTAAIQNMMVLVDSVKEPGRTAAAQAGRRSERPSLVTTFLENQAIAGALRTFAAQMA